MSSVSDQSSSMATGTTTTAPESSLGSGTVTGSAVQQDAKPVSNAVGAIQVHYPVNDSTGGNFSYSLPPGVPVIGPPMGGLITGDVDPYSNMMVPPGYEGPPAFVTYPVGPVIAEPDSNGCLSMLFCLCIILVVVAVITGIVFAIRGSNRIVGGPVYHHHPVGFVYFGGHYIRRPVYPVRRVRVG